MFCNIYYTFSGNFFCRRGASFKKETILFQTKEKGEICIDRMKIDITLKRKKYRGRWGECPEILKVQSFTFSLRGGDFNEN